MLVQGADGQSVGKLPRLDHPGKLTKGPGAVVNKAVVAVADPIAEAAPQDQHAPLFEPHASQGEGLEPLAVIQVRGPGVHEHDVRKSGHRAEVQPRGKPAAVAVRFQGLPRDHLDDSVGAVDDHVQNEPQACSRGCGVDERAGRVLVHPGIEGVIRLQGGDPVHAGDRLFPCCSGKHDLAPAAPPDLGVRQNGADPDDQIRLAQEPVHQYGCSVFGISAVSELPRVVVVMIPQGNVAENNLAVVLAQFLPGHLAVRSQGSQDGNGPLADPGSIQVVEQQRHQPPLRRGPGHVVGQDQDPGARADELPQRRRPCG